MVNLRKLLFEDEAVIGIRTPMDYPYLNILRLTLSFVNSWPLNEPFVWFSRFHLVLCLTTLVGSIAYTVIHNNSLTFLEVGHTYISILMNFVAFSRITTLTFSPEYRILATDFLTKIHLFFYKDRSEYAMKTHKQVHQISHLFTVYLTGQMLAGLSLFNLIPMYSNYSSGRYKAGGLQNSTFEHSLYYSYPFNTSTNINGYIFACIFHWFISCVCSCWFCMFDLFLSLMIFHLWGHFKILLYDLNNFPRPAHKSSLFIEESSIVVHAEIYSENEQNNICEKLKECIDYHREIADFTDRISHVFGPMLLSYYIFHQTSGCLLLLECSQLTAEALMRYVPLTVILFQQLIQLSVIFELIGSTSDKLSDAVYGIPWECMDMRNKRITTILLMNVQEAIHVKAMGVANVGVTSMAMILKTSMSYFTFLRSM